MPDPAEPPAGDVADELDRVIRALSDKRRRYILHAVSVNDDPVFLFDLIVWLTEWDEQLDSHTAEVTLVHTHIPSLETAGLIEFDPDSHAITLTYKGEMANEGRAAYLSLVTGQCC